MEIEDMLAKELKKTLKWLKSEHEFGNMAGRNYVNMNEIQWNIGKTEGIKFAIQKVLKSKGIKQSDFEKKYA